MTFAPTTGDPRLDLLTDLLAHDLLLSPTRVLALASYWVASHVDHTRALLPGPSFVSLVHALGEALAPHGPGCDLVLFLHERDAGRLSYELCLFPGRYNLAITQAFLLRTGAWRALAALGWLLRDADAAFEQSAGQGVRGERVLRQFLGNTRLSYYLRPHFWLTAVATAFAQALVRLDFILGTDPALACAITEPAAEALATTRLWDLASTFMEGASSIQGLGERTQTLLNAQVWEPRVLCHQIRQRARALEMTKSGAREAGETRLPETKPATPGVSAPT